MIKKYPSQSPEYTKEYRRRNAEKRKKDQHDWWINLSPERKKEVYERNKKYHDTHKEKIAARLIQYRNTESGRKIIYAGIKRYTARNKEKINLYHKQYMKTNNGKILSAKAIEKYRIAHPDRIKAWQKARYIKRYPCVKCNNPESHRHHPDITKPMEVVMLCALHHKEAHRLEFVS